MRAMELRTKLEPIKIAKTDDIIIYSKIFDNADSYTFLSFSTAFDIVDFLTNKGHSTVNTGKVLKSTLSKTEQETIEETGLALGLGGTFCTVTMKALLELCVSLGLRGNVLSEPSSNRDLFIASLLNKNLNFVYYQGEHPCILGVSFKEYVPNKWFEMVNEKLTLTLGNEAKSIVECNPDITIVYRYHTYDAITPIIKVMDKMSGTQQYSIEVGYEINGFYVVMNGISGTNMNAVFGEMFESNDALYSYLSQIKMFDKYLVYEYSYIAEYSEYLYKTVKDSPAMTITEFVEFAKKHNIPSDIVSKTLKSVIFEVI